MHTLHFRSENKQGNVQDYKEYRHRHGGYQPAEKHRRSRNAAVVEVNRGKEQVYAHCVDDARNKEHQEIHRLKFAEKIAFFH